MNTRIARRLNEACRHTQLELDKIACNIVEAHNQASLSGFIDLPTLNFCNVTTNARGDIAVAVTPKCGTISLNDLHMLKSAWGADSLDVCNESGLVIILSFLK